MAVDAAVKLTDKLGPSNGHYYPSDLFVPSSIAAQDKPMKSQRNVKRNMACRREALCRSRLVVDLGSNNLWAYLGRY